MISRPSETVKQTAFDSSRTLFVAGLGGSFLTWLAFPPADWSWLAWIAPAFWLVWVQMPQLPGKHPYRVLWLCGSSFWLLTVHWIRLPHPLNHLAWGVLASYLGAYLPLFVALSRVGVHRFGLPLWLVAPVVWTGLDWLRGHLMTGFGMGSLAHTQVGFPGLIQIANLVGEYGVTFLIVLVAACLTQCFLSYRSNPARVYLYYLTPAVIAVAAALFYGAVMFMKHNSLNSRLHDQTKTRIALIQGNYLAEWKSDVDKQRQIMDKQLNLSRQAVRENSDVDLVIWPETSFRQTLVTLQEGYHPPANQLHESHLTAARDLLREFARQLGSSMLVGVDRTQIFSAANGDPEAMYFNSSVLVDHQGEMHGTYDKMHRVPFGEYIPFDEWFPSLYRLTPLTGGIQAGAAPSAMRLGGVNYAVNICYETAVPHLIRRHVVDLSELGHQPDVLVNLTNDAWYWGSSELDMHLACGVFRAVEMRTPLVIAANGGLSAHIDSYGEVQQVSGRQQPQVVLANVSIRSRRGTHLTLYARWGDWFAGICVICCVLLAVSRRAGT